MKEMYQQAVAESERVTKINASEEIQEIQQSAHARSIKERFERGEPIAANEDGDSEDKFKHQDRADEEVIAAGKCIKQLCMYVQETHDVCINIPQTADILAFTAIHKLSLKIS